MKDYAAYYQKITAKIRSSASAVKALNIMNKILTAVMYAMYPLLLILLAFSRDSRFFRVFLIPAASFEILTWARASINRARPYEKWNIEPLIHKDTKGKSMPSRHVFSATIISISWLVIIPWVGIVLLVLSALSAVIRVLGGVHYPSDVIVGFLCGALSGLFFLI